jgi:hypothetical protein
MSDPFRMPPGTNPPRYPPERTSDAIWIAATAAIVLAIGVGFWAVAERPTTNTAAKPPAVTAAPAPPAGIPAPTPDETTGRAGPRSQ